VCSNSDDRGLGLDKMGKSPKPDSTGAKLSFAGFILATLSILLAISSIAIGGFPFHSPQLLGIYGLGSCLSLTALVCALIGLWRPNSFSLRWHALVCSLGSLVFWVIEMAGE
jgi:hypothetical protein